MPQSEAPTAAEAAVAHDDRNADRLTNTSQFLEKHGLFLTQVFSNSTAHDELAIGQADNVCTVT
jgi:hypothetical protein